MYCAAVLMSAGALEGQLLLARHSAAVRVWAADRFSKILCKSGKRAAGIQARQHAEQELRAAGSEEEGYHLTKDFITAMMEHFRRQKTIHKRFAFQILLEVCFGAEQTHCGSVLELQFQALQP